MKPPINHPKAKEVARHAGWNYLRLLISTCHSKINSARTTSEHIQQKISGLISREETTALMNVISHQNQRMENKFRTRHQKKLERRNRTGNNNNHDETKKRWVVNTSKQNLDKSEISLLRKVMNFTVTPKSVPVKEIITAVEQGISKLPRDVKDEVRSDVCSILKHAKPPKVTEICPDERQAMRNLKENGEILVLSADKGNATVVMNKDDYKEQISSMLQDTKTYTPVTDKRRNPTSSTANSLQKKLGKLKKSGNLTESEYFKIKPNDPVPAAFYGLPKVHKIKLSAKDDHYTVADPSEPIPLRLHKQLHRFTNLPSIKIFGRSTQTALFRFELYRKELKGIHGVYKNTGVPTR